MDCARHITDEQLQVVIAELQRLAEGFAVAVQQIVQQEAAINALQTIIEQHGLATPEELDTARGEALQRLTASAEGLDPDDLVRRLKGGAGWKM